MTDAFIIARSLPGLSQPGDSDFGLMLFSGLLKRYLGPQFPGRRVLVATYAGTMSITIMGGNRGDASTLRTTLIALQISDIFPTLHWWDCDELVFRGHNCADAPADAFDALMACRE